MGISEPAHSFLNEFVSLPVSEERAREQEPESQTKTENKMLEGGNEPEPGDHSVASEGVAPPKKEDVKPSKTAAVLPSSSELPSWAPPPEPCQENPCCRRLSSKARELLARFPARQFFCPGGGRAKKKIDWERQGYLDLYSGKAEVARQISRRWRVWSLTFDFIHGEGQDLLDVDTQQLILELIRCGAVWGVGAAPECGSFSRAVTPAVRDREFPYGKPGISQNMAGKVDRGNRHAAFVLAVVLLCQQQLVAYWVENPDGSFLWLLPPWLDAGVALHHRSFRFDMCRFGAPWRKRTRVCTSTALAGVRLLCEGGHSHVVLRGRSSLHQACWTRVAQVYPRAFAAKMALEMGKSAKLGCRHRYCQLRLHWRPSGGRSAESRSSSTSSRAPSSRSQ